MALKLHNFDERIFDKGCIASLNKATKVAVTENLGQPHTLSFEYPMNDDKEVLIQENGIVSVDGQAYRLDDVTRDYSGTRMLKAKATHIFFIDAQSHHIPTIGNDTDVSKTTIGVDPYVVIRKAIENAKNVDGTQKFELISDAELNQMGMTRIGADGTEIDFFPTDKINLYDVILAVIESYGRGEIYVDNYRFAVVERIGKDNGVRLSLKKNLTKLSVQRQRTELTTRLYPYGKDDMTISSVNGNLPYIDSEEGIAKYGIVEGYKDYSDYDDPNKLLAHAKWDLMGEGNDYRLDTPQLTISGDVVDLSKLAIFGDMEKLALGDTVYVHEKDMVHSKRIINITYYPYSTDQPAVTIGVPSNTNWSYGAWLQKKLFKAIKKNSTTITNKMKTKYFTGKVNSSQNPVQSENEQLLLDGDLLSIEDDNGERRINLGNVDGTFVFEIFDSTGQKKTIAMDEDGNVTITGVFATGTDNEARTVIDKNGIQSYGADGNKYGLWCNEPNKDDYRYADLTLYYKNDEIFQIYNEGFFEHLKANGKNFLGTDGDNSYAHGTWSFDEGANGTFTTSDGKTVTVSGGLITDIS